MKAADLRKETDDQLKLSLSETEKHLFKLRFQSATDKLSTPSEIRKAKKDIARIHTEQRRRELASEAKLSDAELAKVAEHATKGETATGKPFIGRRQAKRVMNRVASLVQSRAAAAQAAKKGK